MPDIDSNANTSPRPKLKRLNGWSLNGSKVVTAPSKAAAHVQQAAETILNLEHLMEEAMKKREPSPSHIAYASNSEMPITEELMIVKPEDDTPAGIWPVFRMMVSLLSCRFFVLSGSIDIVFIFKMEHSIFYSNSIILLIHDYLTG